MSTSSSSNFMPNWDHDVSHMNYFISVVSDIALAAGVFFVLLQADLVYAGLAAGLLTYASSVYLLRGFTHRSLGDLVGGIGYSRLSGERPGVWRCVLNDFFLTVSLPFYLLPVELLASFFSEKLTGLRVYSTR